MADSDSTSKQPGDEPAQPKWLVRLRRNPVVISIVVIIAVITAFDGILDFPQRAISLYRTFFPVTTPVRFNSLSEFTVERFGVTFSFPSDWDRQYLPANLDGVEFIDPDNKDVFLVGYGSHSGPTLDDAINQEKKAILALRHAHIIEDAVSGLHSGEDGWRIVYQYVNDSGKPITVMLKLGVADGREGDLFMEAPTGEFARYKSAFLELSVSLALTSRCPDCIGS